MIIQRGDILLIELDPTKGSEIRKTRPGIVVSNDIANRYSPLVTIIPLTSKNIDQIYPQDVLVPKAQGLKTTSKAKASQIRAVDRSRIKSKIGQLEKQILVKVDIALKLHLGLF